MIESMESTLEN